MATSLDSFGYWRKDGTSTDIGNTTPLGNSTPEEKQSESRLPDVPPNTEALAQLPIEQKQEGKDLDNAIILSKEYGLTDINGRFQRFIPADGPAEVAGVNDSQIGIILARVGEHSSESELFAANNRRVAELIGINVDDLNEQQLNNEILQVAESGQYPSEQPAGTSLAMIYTNSEGQLRRVFIPLIDVAPTILSVDGKLTSNGNSSFGQVGLSITGTTEQSHNYIKRRTLGGKLSSDGSTVGASLYSSETSRSIEVNQDLLQSLGKEYGFGVGVGTDGLSFGGSYVKTTTDLYKGTTNVDTSLKLGGGTSGVLFRLDQDMGQVGLSVGVNTIPVGPGIPNPGGVCVLVKVEGSPSYVLLDSTNTNVHIPQGTNNEPLGTFGACTLGKFIVPIVIPGNIFPTRSIKLPPDLAQPQQIAGMSEKILELRNKATDGQFLQEYSNISALYTTLTKQTLKLNSAEIGAHLLPMDELNSGRFNHIVDAFEAASGLEIVDSEGKILVSREQIEQAALEIFLENNPMVGALPEEQKQVVLDYALRAVERPPLPSISELKARGLEYSEKIPFVNDFSIHAEPRVEVFETPEGPVIAAQVAIKVALPNGDDRWIVAEQSAKLDPDLPMRLQVEYIREQVTSKTVKVMQDVYRDMSGAAYRREDLSAVRNVITNELEQNGFFIVKDLDDVNQRWSTLTEQIHKPTEE